MDSEASNHVTCSLDWFTDYHEINDMFVNLPNKSTVPVTHVGNVILSHCLTLQNVLYVPHFTFNLICASKLTLHGTCSLTFQYDTCLIEALPSTMMIGIVKQSSGLYHLLQPDRGSSVSSAATFVNVVSNPVNLWHSRLGHLSDKALKAIATFDFVVVHDFVGPCDCYHSARQKRLVFPVSTSVSDHLFQLIHVDIWGAMAVETPAHYRYFLTIMDDFSRCTWIFLMVNKSEARMRLQNFVEYVRIQFNSTIQIIHSDNG